MNTFKKDLEFGKKYEKIAVEYLEYDNIKFMEGRFKEYDFIIEKDNIKKYIEVKSDKLGYKTGNLAIEYESRGKPSGISATMADFWMYFIIENNNYTCYKIPVDELKEIIKNCFSVCGGDNRTSKLYLLKIDKIKKYKVEKKCVFQN